MPGYNRCFSSLQESDGGSLISSCNTLNFELLSSSGIGIDPLELMLDLDR